MTASSKRIDFDLFSLDLVNQCLWKGSSAIALRPKAYAVLNYLLARPGQLVTKEELLNAVWSETFVGEATLKVTIRQLREALDDDAKSPRYIETAHRRGYRFIAQIGEGGQAQQIELDKAIPTTGGESPAFGVVGRAMALSRMQSLLERMLTGERQIVFVTGEAGIGKTALVDTFANCIASDQTIRIGRGQCLEQYGTGEAYLPVLEAIGRLCREESQVFDVVRGRAPMWLLQMPSLVGASDRELMGREFFGTTRERMLREMGEALEALTAELPLVLILEDLHWSDYSTLDLISYLARQRHPAHLMVIGTFRNAELNKSGHPLKAVKQELLGKQQCTELALEYLSDDAVGEYLSARFPANRFCEELPRFINQRTEGNPLFMVNTVDYLVSEQLIIEREAEWDLAVDLKESELGVPDSIKHLIERQIEHLNAEEQRMLEAASVAGADFSSLAIAAALGEERAIVEVTFDELARQRQFIHECGVQELPNGERATRYAFIHSLYQNVLYERVSVSRRGQFHQRIGERGEEIYGKHATEIAAELAMHYERATNYKQAVKYCKQAAENAIRRFAYREAIALARRGLELLPRLPDTPQRTQDELCLNLTLGVPLIATEGYAAPEVGRIYRRAWELYQQLGDTPDVSEALWGLWTFYTLRAELRTARKLAEEFLRLPERLPYPGLAMRGNLVMHVTLVHVGEFAPAMEYFEKAQAHYNPELHLDDAFLYAQHPGVAMRCFAAWGLWFLGKPDQALDVMLEALALARELSEPHSLAHALLFMTMLHHFRREEKQTQEYAEETLALAKEHGLVMYEVQATIMQGWALVKQGCDQAIKQIHQGLDDYRAIGTELLRPQFLSLLGEALGKAQKPEEGLRLLDEAILTADHNMDASYEAELHRIKGELLLRQISDETLSGWDQGTEVVDHSNPSLVQAEECFQQSIRIAQRQNAKSWELRTAGSLAKLLDSLGRREEARLILEETYDSFTEGFNTVDLIEARTILTDLSSKKTTANIH